MPAGTRTKRLAEHAMKVRLDDFVADLRNSGWSWTSIAAEISSRTDGLVDINRETLRSWYVALDEDGQPVRTRQSPVPGFVTVNQAAEQLGVSAECVRRWFDDGRINGVRSENGPRFVDPESISALPPHLRVTQAARELHVSADTVRAWFDDGTLWGFRTEVGHRRIDPAAIRHVQEAS